MINDFENSNFNRRPTFQLVIPSSSGLIKMQKKRVHILICFVFVSKPENIIFLFVCFEMLSPQGGKFPFLPLLLQVYMFTSIIKHLAELVAQCFPVAKHAYIVYV